MTRWDRDAICGESARWVSPWVPPGARVVQTERVRLYIENVAARLVRADIDAEATDTRTMVRTVLDIARDHGADRLSWDVGVIPRPADLPDELFALGGEISLSLDVCACDLGDGRPRIPVPADVSVRQVTTREDVRSKLQVDAAVWGYSEPTEADVDMGFETLTPGVFLAFCAGELAGTGGYTLAGAVARLWGGGVLPHLRGRGAYRALVDARVRDAATHGATLALVHAGAGTSAPILRGIGFTVYGQRHVITVPTGA